MRSWGYFRKKNNYITLSHALFFMLQKSEKNFAKTIHLLSLHSRNGSIAQLVQSICLTSRGSAVRTRVLPQKFKSRNPLPISVSAFFQTYPKPVAFCNSYPKRYPKCYNYRTIAVQASLPYSLKTGIQLKQIQN